jgi:hypothetical protein
MTAGVGIRLTDADLLAAWEAGAAGPPVARAVAVAARATPERVEEWAIGRRDALLLEIHAAVFGSAIELVTDCPACGEALELTLAVDDVRSPCGDAHAEHELTDAASGVRLVFRLPSSADLLAVAAIDDVADARRALAARCVVTSEPAPELPERAIAALAARIAALDPQADVDLALVCDECGHAWTAPLDVADHVWRRLDARARSLVADVAALASTFGWTEGEILALSADRRRLYLDLVAP